MIGNAEELGKAVGVDAVKNTFVQLYGLEKCDKLVHSYTEQAVKCLNAFEDGHFMVTLADNLTSRTV